MNLPRLVPAVIVTLLLQTSFMHAAKTASCTFDTFSAPSGYSFSQVEGVSDDGTVVGQLVDTKTQQYVAFTRSAGGALPSTPPRNHQAHGCTDATAAVT